MVHLLAGRDSFETFAKNNMESTSPRIIRAAPATVIIFSVLFSPALLLGGLLIWRGQQFPEAIGLCFIYILGVYAICSPAVELSHNQLIYRLPWKRRRIILSEVVGVSMSARPAPTLKLSKGNGQEESLSFVLKPFTKGGVVTIFDHIRRYCPTARFDGISKDMSSGDFSSITQETISSRNLIRIVVIVGSSAVAAAIAQMLFHKP